MAPLNMQTHFQRNNFIRSALKGNPEPIKTAIQSEDLWQLNTRQHWHGSYGVRQEKYGIIRKQK